MQTICKIYNIKRNMSSVKHSTMLTTLSLLLNKYLTKISFWQSKLSDGHVNFMGMYNVICNMYVIIFKTKAVTVTNPKNNQLVKPILTMKEEK